MMSANVEGMSFNSMLSKLLLPSQHPQTHFYLHLFLTANQSRPKIYSDISEQLQKS